MRSIPHSLRRVSMNCAVLGMCESSLLVACVRYRREQRVFGLPGVEAGVLHHVGHAEVDHARVVGVGGYGFGVGKLVETDVPRSPGGQRVRVRPRGLAVLEVDGDLDVGLLSRGVQQARRLLARKLWFEAVAPGGNIALRYSP